MKPTLAVVDYGMGNLRSVQKALEKSGSRAVVTSRVSEMRRADGLVLPGVGAFGEAMRRLRHLRLVPFLRRWIEQRKPFLGICLGLQLLFDASQESPGVPGLKILRGRVVRFRFRHRRLTVPHMGWNTLEPSGRRRSRMLAGISSKTFFYFVHSFYPVPRETRHAALWTTYGHRFCSAVEGPNLFASQFHPEKSGPPGLRLLRNFIRSIGPC